MWITTSKQADTHLKRAAQALADAWPDARFVRRGERGLERIEELAAREAQDTLLVLSSDGARPSAASSPPFILRSRQRKEGRWAWQHEEMAVQKMQGPRIAERSAKAKQNKGENASPAEPEPFSITAHGASAEEIARFFGMRDHPLARYYEEARKVEVETSERKDRFSLTIDRESVLDIVFGWQALCEKKG